MSMVRQKLSHKLIHNKWLSANEEYFRALWDVLAQGMEDTGVERSVRHVQTSILCNHVPGVFRS